MKPIRILHVVTSMNLGGIEVLLMTLYRNIDRNKIQFDFLVHRKEKGFFDDEIIALGGKIHRVQPLKPIKVHSYYRELSIFFKENKEYKIVHSHLNANSTLVLWIAKKCGIRHRIAHSHIDKTGGSNVFLKSILKRGINKVSTKRFACSKQAGFWLFRNATFDVFKNSIDSSSFKFNEVTRKKIRRKLRISDKTILIGNIARFNEQKNHLFIINVFHSYLKINQNASLILIGNGNLMGDVESKAKTLGIFEQIIFTGAIQNANEYLNAMDLFLFPSLYEGLGIVAVEAQCNGMPVLMTDSLPDEVEITDLVKRLSLNKSANEWARVIEKQIAQKKNRDGYQKQIIDSGYDINKNAKILTEFYLNLKQ